MMTRLLIGETLLNQFRVENFIASGGMATIYRVFDVQRHVHLAMKVLHPELAEDPAFMARFQREARALQSLSHPHIVPFYGLYRAQDLTFLLEQYIDGPSLDEILRRRAGAPLPVWESLVYFKALYTSLGYAHNQGIIHCDVKPGNVLIDQGGHVYLTDFGIARYAESTGSTSAIGTPIYMAPEQIRGERVSPETDVYSLAVLLFELFCGQRPFSGDGDYPDEAGPSQVERLRYAHLNLPPPDPRAFNPDLPPELAAVILNALAKDPQRRYPNMQAFAEALFAAVDTRFEALPGRVRPPEEQAQVDGAFGPQVAVGDFRPQGEWEAAPAAPTRRISPRLLVALGSALLVILCLLAGTRLFNGLVERARGEGLAGLPTGANPTATAQSGEPTGTPAPGETVAPAGDLDMSGEFAVVMRSAGRDRLYTVSTAGDDFQEVTNLPEAEGSWAPQWSPNGEKLAWNSQYDGRWHVVVSNLGNGEARELAAGEIFERVSAPAWLANGEQVSFWAYGKDTNWLAIADSQSGDLVDQFDLPAYRNLFVWNWATGQLAFIHNPGPFNRVVISSTPRELETPVNLEYEAYAPAWSRDGQWLAFQGDTGGSQGDNEIWIVRSDGSDLRRVTYSPAGTWSRAPTWSPDGRYIAYVSNRAGSIGADFGELFVVDVETSEFRQITSTGGNIYDWRPAWRPR